MNPEPYGIVTKKDKDLHKSSPNLNKQIQINSLQSFLALQSYCTLNLFGVGQCCAWQNKSFYFSMHSMSAHHFSLNHTGDVDDSTSMESHPQPTVNSMCGRLWVQFWMVPLFILIFFEVWMISTRDVLAYVSITSKHI